MEVEEKIDEITNTIEKAKIAWEEHLRKQKDIEEQAAQAE